MPRRFVIVALVMVALAPRLAAQTSDTTPPQLVSFSFGPASIDTRTLPQPVIVTAEITDDLSGVNPARFSFVSPSGKQSQSGWLFYVSGSTYRGTLNFPQFTESGTWKVKLSLYDKVYNVAHLSASVLQGRGFPTDLVVVSTPDVSPPVVTSFSLAPSSVDVSSGARSITVTIGLSDVVGASFSSLPDGSRWRFSLVSPTTKQDRLLGENVDFQPISWSPPNSTWRATLNMPQYSEAGVWNVSYLQLSDLVGNLSYVRGSDLRAGGFATEVTVTSVPADTTPPRLLSLSFVPSFIDTSVGPQTVTVTAGIADDLSGVDLATWDTRWMTSCYGVQFRSPTQAQSRFATCPALSFVPGGTPLNGFWQGTTTFPQYSEAGTWKVSYALFKDSVRNITRLAASDFVAMGLPTDLVVVKPSLVVDGTIADPAVGGTITDQVFGSRAQITFPPGVLSAATQVAIDVFQSPLAVPTPSGFVGPGTHFVNVNLTPQPAFPLSAPGLTIVLPLVNAMIPGDRIDLFRVDPATGSLVPALNVAGQPAVGLVDAGGLSVTFSGIARLSTVVGLVPNVVSVMIDIKPGEQPSSINRGSGGTTPVAILSSASFSAVTNVNTASLRFGRTGDEQSLAFCNRAGEDVNGDGLRDLVCHFTTRLTGFQTGDTLGVLKGKTVSNFYLRGTDYVRVLH